MTHSSSQTENQPGHDLLSLKMALRNGTSTKLWMPAGVAGVYNTLSVMKDMGRSMMSGVLVQKWPRWTPSMDGKMRTEQKFETHSILLGGEGCKPAPTDS